MEYTELNRRTLSKLGLLPLKKWQLILDIINCGGTAYKYELKHPTHSERYIFFTSKLKNDSDADACYVGEIHLADFNDITEEFLKKEFAFTDIMIKKYMWLKKYLNGEVNGRYNKYDSAILNRDVNAKIEQLQNRIGFLTGKINRIEDERYKYSVANTQLRAANANLRRENAQLKAEIHKMKFIAEAIENYNDIIRRSSHEQ